MAKSNAKDGSELFDLEKFFETYGGEDRVVRSAELYKKLSEEKENTPRIETGMPTLDRLLDGVEAGELIVVTGPSGEGKTTLLMSITKNISRIKSLWFTLEVTPLQFMEKLKMSSDELPDFLIPQASMDRVKDDYVKRWEKERGRQYETMDWIEDKIIEAKVKYDTEGDLLRVLFIDHVHMLFMVDKISRSLSLEIGDLVARIKHWALSRNLVIFLVAHCRDIPTEQSLREPRMGDIRDSGMITRLADTVIGVWRIRNDNDGSRSKREQIREEDNKAKVVVFKNRRKGRLGWFVTYHHNHYLSEDAWAGEEI